MSEFITLHIFSVDKDKWKCSLFSSYLRNGRLKSLFALCVVWSSSTAQQARRGKLKTFKLKYKPSVTDARAFKGFEATAFFFTRPADRACRAPTTLMLARQSTITSVS